MLKKLLVAIAILLHIGLVFAQTTVKPPPSPFSFDGTLNASNLPDVPPPLPQVQANIQSGIASDSILNNIQDEQERQYYAQMMGIENKSDPDFINNVSDKVFNTFKEEFKDAANKLKPYVLYIFYRLVIFSFLWLLLMQTWQGWSFKEFSANFLITLFHASIYNLLILNFPDIALYIPNFFAKIGIAVSKVPIQESDILNYGVNYIKNVWDSLSIGQPAVAIMYIVLSVPTLYMILQMVRIYVCVLIEGLVIGQLNIIYLAFAGTSKLDSYAKKPFIYLISIGLRLMFLQIFFGAILGIIAKYATMKISQDVVLVMLISTSLTYWLVNEVMSIVNSFIMGHSNSTNFGSFKTALKDTLLDTYKAVQSMNEAKKLMDKAKELEQQNTIAKMYDPDFAQRFAPKFNDDTNSSSNNATTPNNAQQNTSQASHNTTQGANFNQNTMHNFNANSKVDNGQNSSASQNNTTSSNSNNLNQEIKSQNTDINNANDKQAAHTNTSSITQSSQANQSMPNNNLNSIAGNVKSVTTAAKAMLDNDFNLKQANQHLDSKLQAGELKINKALMSATDTKQEKLWNKIYLGQSPSHMDEAKKYIQHGNELKNNPQYAQQYSQYVEQKRQAYQESLQNSIKPNYDLDTSNQDTQDKPITRGQDE